jgi:hypothetical protein
MSKQELTKTVNSIFEQIKRIDENGNEFWSARDFAKVLEYADYRNFINVVNKAKEACKNSKHKIADHIVDVNDMIIVGKGAERQVDSMKLSRYACYATPERGKSIAHGNAMRRKSSINSKPCKGVINWISGLQPDKWDGHHLRMALPYANDVRLSALIYSPERAESIRIGQRPINHNNPIIQALKGRNQ